MKRRGDLLADNFLEIILAVLGLIAVGYLAYQIYQVSVNQESTIAKKMLDSLEGKINRLQIGETGSYTLKTPCEIKGECDWFLAGWSTEDLDRPDKCSLESCVCVCKGGYGAHHCQSAGFCRFFDDSSVSVIGSDTIKEIRNVGTDPVPMLVDTGIKEAVRYIRLKPLHLLNVQKEDGAITISAG
jgi:hypothetical protein